MQVRNREADTSMIDLIDTTDKLTPRQRTLLHGSAVMVAMLAGLVPAIQFVMSNSPLLGSGVMPHGGDAVNIVQRATAISHGTSPTTWPDPPLRYLPMSVLIIVLRPLFSPPQIVIGYTLTMEFIAIPIALALLVRRWDSRAVVPTMLIYAVVSQTIGQGGGVTMLTAGYWMYAYAIPPFLLAIRSASTPQSWRRAGVWLGVTAMLQLIIGAIGALIVAVTYALRQEWSLLTKTAVTSMVTALPLVPIGLVHYHYWLSSGGKRADLGAISTASVADFFLLMAVGISFISYGLLRAGDADLKTVQHFPASAVGAGISLPLYFIAVKVLHSYWFGLLTSYIVQVVSPGLIVLSVLYAPHFIADARQIIREAVSEFGIHS